MDRFKRDASGRRVDDGLQADAFEQALESAKSATDDPNYDRFATHAGYTQAGGGEEKWPRLPGSDDHGDPFGNAIKPTNVKTWDHVPSTPEEKAVYQGLHIHTESNPLGLHSHMPGGNPGGAHTHGPQNRLGAHHHKEIDPEKETNTTSYQLDGEHAHEHGENLPSGPHAHSPENFG